MRFPSHLQRLAEKVWRNWSSFWFEADYGAQMPVFRALVGGLLFAFYLLRTFDLELYFSESGLLPLEVIEKTMSPEMGYRLSLFEYLDSATALWMCHVLFLASLLTLALGRFARTSAVIALVLHLSFVHRNMSAVFGIDLIATFYLFYLCFADSTNAAAASVRRWMGSAAFRLCQIQLCIIYAYSGMEKLKGSHWWRGEAVWDVLANSQLARFDFSWIAHFPLLIVGATYLTLLWELYFPVLVWSKKLRPWVLTIGIFLHAGMGFALNIPYFSALMVVTYVLFLEKKHIDDLKTLRFFVKFFRGVSMSTVSGLGNFGGYSKP